MTQDWTVFYKFENSGAVDVWLERMMFEADANGLYAFSIVRPPDDEDDTAYTEWDSDEPVPPQQVLEQIVDAIKSRGLSSEYAIGAAINLLDHLPTDRADIVYRSITAALSSDQKLRMAAKKLPSGIRRRQIRRITGKR
jgi:hypothetical protein